MSAGRGQTGKTPVLEKRRQVLLTWVLLVPLVPKPEELDHIILHNSGPDWIRSKDPNHNYWL